MRFAISYLDWWRVPLAFSNQKGAVTAEFLLLFPTVVLTLAGILGVFQLGVAQLALAREAFTQARAISIGEPISESPGLSLRSWSEGKLTCVEATRQLVFKLEAEACYFEHGL